MLITAGDKMVSITMTSEHLIIRILGWDKVRALCSSLTIPRAHVTGVRARPPEAHFDDVIIESWRGVGTYIPGKIAAGTCRSAQGQIFFDVRDPAKSIAVDLEGERVRHIVVELAEEAPEHAVERIERELWLHGVEAEGSDA
jgi:hypothetical protein